MVVATAVTATIAGAALSGTTVGLLLSVICLVVLIITMVQPRQYTKSDHTHQHLRLKNFPGGPHRLPLIGNIKNLSGTDTPYIALTELIKKHGEIFSLKLGDEWFLVLNSTETIREAFEDYAEEFSGRLLLYSSEVLSDGFRDVSFTDYTQEWRHHRQLFTKSLMSFTSGTRLEEIAHERLGVLEKYLDEHLGSPVQGDTIINMAVLGMLTRICFGYENDEIHEQMMKLIPGDIAMLVIGKRMAVDVFTFMKHFSSKEKKFIHAVADNFNALIAEEVKRHRETYQPGVVRDMIDELIRAQIEAKGNGETHLDFFTDEHITQTIANVLVGGGIGTCHSSYWGLACMAENPRVQDKLSDIACKVLGLDRKPQLSDRTALNYADATVNETLRYASAAPMGVPRKSTCDVSFRGYTIPKGTPVLYNMYAVHFDEKNFEQPYQFKPERFLGDDGSIKDIQSFIPFGVGHRQCVGKSQGETIMFFLFAWLFHRYSFSKLPEQEQESLLTQHPEIQAARSPKSYSLIVRKRF